MSKCGITEEVEMNLLELKQILGDSLPADLNTDLNLKRWLNGYLLLTYAVNRRVAGLDSPSLLENVYENVYVKKLLVHLQISLKSMVVNEYDNSIVVVCLIDSVSYHDLARVVTPSEMLMYYFALTEYFFKQVLAREKATGRRSGLTFVFDVANFHVVDYVNPRSRFMQLFSLCASVIQDYYCDVLQRLCLLNCGYLLKAVLQLAKLVLVPLAFEKVSGEACDDDDLKFD
ncbi:unnamed protein product [Soboliphyme baturini]|uniref:CRAL-TRIO domain-containing protein n=1 Tax=Soboliphyme baturini TaxID=241478 RepID=A0A183J278_9BILA|nr:unnamed protein product [Soboliphyme baturini]